MPKLAIIAGPETGKAFEIGDVELTVIGRAKAADIVIDDKSVSRRHAQFENQGTEFAIHDLGSQNGTWVDGERVTREVLRDGAEIKVGSVLLRFRDDRAYEISGPDGSTAALLEGRSERGTGMAAGKHTESQSVSPHTPTSAEETDVKKLRERLNLLCELGESIVSTEDFDGLLDTVMEHLFGLFAQAERALLLLRGRRTGRLTLRALRRRGQQGPQRVIISRSILREVIATRNGVLLSDVSSDLRFLDAESLKAMPVTSVICAPLMRGDRVLGVLHVDTASKDTPFDKHDLRVLLSVAAEVSLAVQNIWAVQDKEHLYLGNIMSLVRAMESKDEYTRGHSDRVAEYAVAIGKQWNKGAHSAKHVDLAKLRFAGYLHDIGKIGVRDTVLNKARELTEDEMAHVRTHARQTAYILEGMYLSEDMKDLDRIACLHHERYDGDGYPNGLSGESIPVEARILAVADAYDAMTSDRPYRQAMGAGDAIAQLRQAGGGQLDPRLVEIFLTLYDDGAVEEVQMSHRGRQRPDSDTTAISVRD